MYSIYKYYENPALQVKGNAYTNTDEYIEVKELFPKIKFFDG